MSGRLLILSGPSGVGKDTIIDAWHQINPLVIRVVATTTRPRRHNEIEGVHYNFVSEEQFQNHIQAGDFLEYKAVHGNWYATPRKSVNDLLSKGHIVVLKIDVQGALEVMKECPEALSVFLLPPDKQALENRIRNRGTETEESIQERMANAQEELSLAHCYTKQIVNETVEDCVQELERIAKAEEAPA